jgi:hypothetical protein
VGTSSSAKKVARLAQKGKGRKVRFQGGTVFPAVVAAVIVVGLALIFYSRATVPGLNAVEQAEQQVKIGHGIYLCDEWVVVPTLDDPAAAFTQFGVGNLAEGVAVMNPLPADGTRGPRLGNLLGAYGVRVTDTRLTLPEGVAPETQYDETSTKCDGETATLSVLLWGGVDASKPDRTFITAFDDVRFTENGQLVAVVFAPSGTEVPVPPSVDALRAQLTGPVAPTTSAPDASEPDTPETTSPTTTEG